jgi:hypothetical protein
MPATPRCPYCNAHGTGLIAIQPIDQYAIIYCGQCGAIYNVLPRPQQKQEAEKPEKSTPQPPVPVKKVTSPPVSPALEEAGFADLSKHVPYNPVAIAAKIRAAGLNSGTMYRHIGIPDGPPQCPTHQVDLVKSVIPPNYPNAGKTVWVCPKNCNQWRLAETTT